jgi:hypothetical protein
MATATAKRKFYGNQYAGKCWNCGYVFPFSESAHPEMHECGDCATSLNEQEDRFLRRCRITVLPTYDQARHSMEPWELCFPGLTR